MEHNLLLLPLFVGIATASSGSLSPMGQKWLAKMPEEMVLHAPYTPFKSDAARTLNVSDELIGALAAQAAAFGVTTVWVPGSMGQFDVLTIAERKALVEAWVKAGKNHSLYIIAHVGTPVLAEAQELAKHAQSVGADAIASVPPYYERVSTPEGAIAFLKPIADSAPKLPLFYYHIPGLTHTEMKMYDLLVAAKTSLPSLMGIKYVSSDMGDWFNTVQAFNSTKALMFAPEPKLASFGLGVGRGTVLAEDFFAQTYLRMKHAFFSGSGASQGGSAAKEQAWKLKAGAVFGKYGGGTAERSVYKTFPLTKGVVDLGPPRMPQKALAPADEAALWKDLEAVDFWKMI